MCREIGGEELRKTEDRRLKTEVGRRKRKNKGLFGVFSLGTTESRTPAFALGAEKRIFFRSQAFFCFAPVFFRSQPLSWKTQAFSKRKQAFSKRTQAFSRRIQALSKRKQAFSKRKQAFRRRTQALSWRIQALIENCLNRRY